MKAIIAEIQSAVRDGIKVELLGLKPDMLESLLS